MRTIVAFACLILPMSPALGQQMQERQTIGVGPWSIATTYKAEKFEILHHESFGIRPRNKLHTEPGWSITESRLDQMETGTRQCLYGTSRRRPSIRGCQGLGRNEGSDDCIRRSLLQRQPPKSRFSRSERRGYPRFASRWTVVRWRWTVLRLALRKMVVRAERQIRSSRPIVGRSLPMSASDAVAFLNFIRSAAACPIFQRQGFTVLGTSGPEDAIFQRRPLSRKSLPKSNSPSP